MTQQKLLPIARRITGGFNVPSSFHPEGPSWDQIWHLPACHWGKARRQGNAGWWREQEGRQVKREAWPREGLSFGEGTQAPALCPLSGRQQGGPGGRMPEGGQGGEGGS